MLKIHRMGTVSSTCTSFPPDGISQYIIIIISLLNTYMFVFPTVLSDTVSVANCVFTFHIIAVFIVIVFSKFCRVRPCATPQMAEVGIRECSGSICPMSQVNLSNSDLDHAMTS